MARPNHVKISVSGYSQKSYGKTHRGGDIETVKRNMREFSHIIRRTNSGVSVEVDYHKYLDNEDEEDEMQKYATALGYQFTTTWAGFGPLEKALTYIADPFLLAQDDLDLIGKLAVPPDTKFLDALAKSGLNQGTHCDLRENQVVINSIGDVQLCCGVYDENQYSLGNYLQRSLAEIQQEKWQRFGNRICHRCMGYGLNRSYRQPALEFIGRSNREKYRKTNFINS